MHRNFPNANYVHEYGFFVGLKNKIMSSIETKKFANIFFKSFIWKYLEEISDINDGSKARKRS